MELRLVKEVIEDLKDSVVLNGINIAGTDYDVTIINRGERLSFSFAESSKRHGASEEFDITINEDKKIKFSRHQYRPSHDHDDNQTLQRNKKTGEIFWFTRFPYRDDDKEFFTVDFGPETVSY